jgi:hypothetical protein
VTASLTVSIGFLGPCPSHDDTFATFLQTEVKRHVRGQLLCADLQSPWFVTCETVDVRVRCPDDSLHYRRRREAADIGVDVVIRANITYVQTKTRC